MIRMDSDGYKAHTHFRSEQVAQDERVRDEPSGPSEVKYPTEEVQLISMTPRSTVRGSNDFAVESVYFSNWQYSW